MNGIENGFNWLRDGRVTNAINNWVGSKSEVGRGGSPVVALWNAALTVAGPYRPTVQFRQQVLGDVNGGFKYLASGRIVPDTAKSMMSVGQFAGDLKVLTGQIYASRQTYEASSRRLLGAAAAGAQQMEMVKSTAVKAWNGDPIARADVAYEGIKLVTSAVTGQLANNGIRYVAGRVASRTVGAEGAGGRIIYDSPIGPVAAERATLSPFTTRYLAESGGRWGGTATRTQNYGISQTLESRGFTVTNGGGIGPEEFIKGAGPGSKGGTFVDITSTAANGRTVRIQTIDTLANGLPTPAEAAAAARIRAAFPGDKLILVPKGK
jgi:hypothetical protein